MKFIVKWYLYISQIKISLLILAIIVLYSCQEIFLSDDEVKIPEYYNLKSLKIVAYNSETFIDSFPDLIFGFGGYEHSLNGDIFFSDKAIDFIVGSDFNFVENIQSDSISTEGRKFIHWKLYDYRPGFHPNGKDIEYLINNGVFFPSKNYEQIEFDTLYFEGKDECIIEMIVKFY